MNGEYHCPGELAEAADLAAMLPELLWLYHMGIVLYWVYDRSPDAARTTRLVARTTAVVARLISLSRFKSARRFNPGIVVSSTPRMRLRCAGQT